jgi:hypothetical protein
MAAAQKIPRIVPQMILLVTLQISPILAGVPRVIIAEDYGKTGT